MRRILLIILVFLFSFQSSFAEDDLNIASIGVGKKIEVRKHLIRNILSADALRFGYSALSIVLDVNQIEPRGKMQWTSITLSPNVDQEGEFIKLLIHEVGHYIDIYKLVWSSSRTDPSEIFYGISWKDRTTKKAWEGMSSFVSGYAATNKYEDFAESLVFYMFHNAEFADRGLKNDSLRQKYLFFQDYLFPQEQFVGTDFRTSKIPNYLWDTTKVPISVKKYLYSIQ